MKHICRSVPNGDVAASCCFFNLLDSSSTRENPMLSDDDGHFAISIAVIAPRRNFFYKLTEGKSVNGFLHL
jgi:hypothetical protein